MRRNRLLKKVTRAEIEVVVKLWLRFAVDRCMVAGMPDAADRLELTLSRQIIATDVLAMNIIKFGLIKTCKLVDYA